AKNPLIYMDKWEYLYIFILSTSPKMKLVIKIILASIVSTFAFIGAMGAANPWPAFAVAFGSWFLLIWSLTPSGGIKQDRREREQAMEDLMRDWERTRRNRF